ncbi:hypothetical protein BH23ACT8_BH23ACT8_18960 [soil metagenome]
MRAMIGAGGHDDADAAALFVRAQVSWLRRGLERADDCTAVAMVLAVHDAAHREWLELLPRLDGPARAAADELYAFCGRVAGTLQRGPDPRLPAATSAAVRALHAERLTGLARATEMGIMGIAGACEDDGLASAQVLAPPVAG